MQDQQNVYVDIGNSFIKAAIRDGLEWRRLLDLPRQEAALLPDWLAGRSERVFLCSVDSNLSEALAERFSPDQVRVIRYRDIPAETLDYQSVETLGLDRYAACLGASSKTSNAVVVIDAGTACTIDYMSAGGVFQGGVIMPGLSIFTTALGERIPALRLEDPTLPDRWPGRNSSECIRWGTVGACLEAIGGFLKRYREMCGSFQLYLTGGDAQWIAQHVDLDPVPRVRPFLVFEGMEVLAEQLDGL